MKKKSFGVSLIGMLILSIETIQPAAAAEDTSDPERGANLIESRCSDCHTSESLIPAVQAHPETERAEFLDAFLKTHYVPDDLQRADIIQYLTSETAKALDQ